MRSFLGKIFLCMVLVPILARGTGMLITASLSDPRPQFARTLDALTPALAALAADNYRTGGEASIMAALKPSGDLVRFLPAAAHCHDDRPGAMTATVPGANGACLGAVPPPRPFIFGLIPASYIILLPGIELLCGGFVAFFLARYLAAPIRRTRAAAMRFAAGDLAARSDPARSGHRRDEAADLERDFNRMADRVAAMIEAQQRFIGDVSHEIRSPLGRLALNLGLLRREAAPNLLPRLDRMEQELDATSRLVAELLTLATLQGSVAPTATDIVDLDAVLQTVVDDLTFEFGDRDQGIRIVRPHGGAAAARPPSAGPVTIKGDAALIRRAIENVLRNALFYTPDDTRVEALIDTDGDWARLVIRDHGPGVPDTALPHLFEPFFRVDEARARNTGGAGLGLAISQRAVALHGGHIRAANVAPHGLSVRIELPVALPAAA